ncbi:MAG: FmdB family transcriptional regulator [Chloroflexi bacterium]|nr:FmdB family transcriptional regulator [Chloroflexota bacterium]
MPTYEYECTRCPSRFELKRGFHDESPVSCPQCGGKARRIFSPAHIIFKGSGFYVTDSREKSGRPSSKAKTNEVKTGSENKTDTADKTISKDKAVSSANTISKDKTVSTEKAS